MLPLPARSTSALRLSRDSLATLNVLFRAACGALAPLVLSAAAAAQAGPGQPVSAWADLPELDGEARVDVPDIALLLHEDELRGHRPLRYGVVQPLALGLHTAGRFDPVPGGLVWRCALRAPGALSLGLEFAQLELPIGAELYVRGADGERTDQSANPAVLGPYTRFEFAPNGTFATPPVAGEHAQLELFLPGDTATGARLTVSGAIYDYRGVFELERGLQTLSSSGGSGAACAVDGSCPAGAPYELERRATVRTLDGGTLCSGALINTAEDGGAGLVLTAEHCDQGVNTIFRFSFERPLCNGGSPVVDRNLTGASLIASDTDTDHRLLQLTQAIPSAWEPYFAGWTRSSVNPGFGLCVHHPGGSPKSIAIDPDGPGKSIRSFIGIGPVKVWDVDFTLGGTDGGSSGAPLFDAEGRLRGVLTGGPETDCKERYFGRFYNFLNEQSAAVATLDPLASGAQVVDGFDPSGGSGPSAPTITALTPDTLPAISVDGAQSVVVDGTGFAAVTEVRLAGTPLEVFPPQFEILSDTQLRVDVLPQATLGPLDLEIINPNGSALASLTIEPVTAPLVNLTASDPEFILSSIGLQIDTASQPADIVYLLGSLSGVPTILPGLISADLGNGGLQLNVLSIFSIPAAGWQRTDVPLAGVPIPPGTKLYVQAGVISAAAPVLPVTTSNLEIGTLLF